MTSHVYEFVQLQLHALDIIGPLANDGDMVKFDSWLLNFKWVMSVTKETVGWVYDNPKAFDRAAGVLRIEEILLMKVVTHKLAVIHMRLAGAGDKLAALVDWYAKSTFSTLVKKEADEMKQGNSSIIEYFASKLEKIQFAYAAGIKDNSVTAKHVVDKIVEGLNEVDAGLVGFSPINNLDSLLLIVEAIQSRRDKALLTESDAVVKLAAMEAKADRLEEQLSAMKVKAKKKKEREKNDQESKKETEKKPGRKLCADCGLVPPEGKHRYCRPCHDDWVAKMKAKKKKGVINAIGDDDDDFSGSDEAFLSAVQTDLGIFHLDQSRHLISTYECDGVKTSVMWDTGATVSFGEESVSYIKYRDRHTSVTYANGVKESSSKMGLIQMNVGDNVMSLWVRIVKRLPTPIIVGMDFMRRRAVIDLIQGIVTIKDVKSESVASVLKDELKKEDYPCLQGLSLKLADMIFEYIKKFKLMSESGWSKCPENIEPFDVLLKDQVPVRQSPKLYYGEDREVVDNMIKKWCDLGILKRSKSKYASSVLLVTKKVKVRREKTGYVVIF